LRDKGERVSLSHLLRWRWASHAPRKAVREEVEMLRRRDAPVTDSIERALVVIQAIGWVVTVLNLAAIFVLYQGWHQKVPVAIGVAPFCVVLGAGIGCR
jgi:hypothetical protein